LKLSQQKAQFNFGEKLIARRKKSALPFGEFAGLFSDLQKLIFQPPSLSNAPQKLKKSAKIGEFFMRISSGK